MNKRQVIVLWIIALVLALAVGALKLATKDHTAQTTRRTPGQTLFENLPAQDVATIQVTGADGSVTLRRKDGGWTVAERDDYPARPSMPLEFLRTLGDLKVTRGIEAGPSFAPRFGMDESAKSESDRGLTVTMSDAAGKELAKVSFGKNIESSRDSGLMGGGMSVGRYIRNHADESGFYATGEMFPSITTVVSPWLDNTFINPEKIRSISVSEAASDKIAWKVARETEDAEFKLDAAAPGEVLDSAAAAPLKSLFSYARFDDVVPAAELAKRADSAGKRIVIVETFEGFTYRLTLAPVHGQADQTLLTADVSATLPTERKKEADEKPEDAKTKDEAFTSRLKTLQDKLAKESKLAGRHFQLAKSTVEALLKDRAALLTKAQAPTPGQGAPANVQQAPGGLIANPPVQAVTPPLEIPAASGE